MRYVGPGVVHIPLAPRDAINAYLVGDVLVDAGIRGSGATLVGLLRGRVVRAHALTHAHPDHAGGSKAVADAFGIPVWAGEADADAVAAGRIAPTAGRAAPLMAPLGRFPAVTPERRLREGDEVGEGFVVLDTPGHSAGHISLWREEDRTLICGDVLFAMNPVTLRPGLREPPGMLTADPARNRESIRRLAGLRPSTVMVGHGPVMTGAAPKLEAFAAAL